VVNYERGGVLERVRQFKNGKTKFQNKKRKRTTANEQQTRTGTTFVPTLTTKIVKKQPEQGIFSLPKLDFLLSKGCQQEESHTNNQK